MDIPIITRIILLSLACSWATAQPVILTSDLNDSGRTYYCANQRVTYTCMVNSSSLIWIAPPLVTTQDPIIFRFDDSVPNPRLAPSIVAILTAANSTMLTSTFQVQSTNVEVTCDTGDPLISITSSLQLGGSGEDPSTMPSLMPLPGSLSANLNWTDPDHSSYDFSEYEVEIYFNNNKSYSVQVQTNFALLSFDFGENGTAYAIVKTVTACPGRESGGVRSNEIAVSIEPFRDPSPIGVDRVFLDSTVGLAVVMTIFIIIILIFIIVISCCCCLDCLKYNGKDLNTNENLMNPPLLNLVSTPVPKTKEVLRTPRFTIAYYGVKSVAIQGLEMMSSPSTKV